MSKIYLGYPQDSIKQWIIDHAQPANDKLRLVVETTADYKKSGIYSAQRDDTSKPVMIDWGDGTVEQVNGDVSQKVHTYATVGTFNVVVENIKSYVASTEDSTWYLTTSQNLTTLKEVIVIPDSVTSIEDLAFYNCRSLTSMTIGNRVTSIGNRAFSNCFKLMSVTIGRSVTSVGYNAFEGCNKLKIVYITDLAKWCGISFNNYMSNPLHSANNLYLNGEKVMNLVIPDSVTHIGNYAFYYCSSLTNVTIPDSVTSIGLQAFSNCLGLTSMTIPNNVINIGNVSFSGTDGLLSISFEGKTISQVQSMTNYPFGFDQSYDLSPETKTITCTDGSFTITTSCILKGTDILLADGTTKKIENLTYNDILKVWDFDEGQLGSAKVCWLTRPGLKSNHYYQLTFDNGTILKTTGINSNHRIFSVDQGKFTNVCDAKVGDKVFSIDGTLTITDVKYIEEECEYYNVMTSGKINCFANGILTSDRYGNLYPIVDMKYVKDGRTIRPYSEYEAVGIDKYWYDNLRLGENTETVEKSKEYVWKCLGQMLPLPNNE